MGAEAPGERGAGGAGWVLGGGGGEVQKGGWWGWCKSAAGVERIGLACTGGTGQVGRKEGTLLCGLLGGRGLMLQVELWGIPYLWW